MLSLRRKVKVFFVAWVTTSILLAAMSVYFHWPVWANVISIFVFNVVAAAKYVHYATSIRRENERSHNKSCRYCGYDLGAEITQCPECGSKFDPDEPIL